MVRLGLSSSDYPFPQLMPNLFPTFFQLFPNFYPTFSKLFLNFSPAFSPSFLYFFSTFPQTVSTFQIFSELFLHFAPHFPTFRSSIQKTVFFHCSAGISSRHGAFFNTASSVSTKSKPRLVALPRKCAHGPLS